jgi:hypothetical protein
LHFPPAPPPPPLYIHILTNNSFWKSILFEKGIGSIACYDSPLFQFFILEVQFCAGATRFLMHLK